MLNVFGSRHWGPLQHGYFDGQPMSLMRSPMAQQLTLPIWLPRLGYLSQQAKIHHLRDHSSDV